MGKGLLYFDLETRLRWDEVGLDPASPEFRARHPAEQEALKAEAFAKLGLSFAATLESGGDVPVYYGAGERDIPSLFRALDEADAIVGHTIWRHDYCVLKPYAARLLRADIFERYRDKTSDLQYMLEQLTGRVLSLDNLAHANLGQRQLMKSKEVPGLFQDGSPDSLKKIKAHLAQNLLFTGSIHELGREFHELKYYVVEGGQIQAEKSVPVDW
jgi:hypothetical protein